MAARKKTGTMQRSLSDLMQERDVVTQAIAQLEAVLDTLRGSTKKRRGRPRKVQVEETATPTRRKPGPKPGSKRTKKTATRTAGRKKASKR
jgi:hypothetical protein